MRIETVLSPSGSNNLELLDPTLKIRERIRGQAHQRLVASATIIAVQSDCRTATLKRGPYLTSQLILAI